MRIQQCPAWGLLHKFRCEGWPSGGWRVHGEMRWDVTTSSKTKLSTDSRGYHRKTNKQRKGRKKSPLKPQCPPAQHKEAGNSEFSTEWASYRFRLEIEEKQTNKLRIEDKVILNLHKITTPPDHLVYVILHIGPLYCNLPQSNIKLSLILYMLCFILTQIQHLISHDAAREEVRS